MSEKPYNEPRLTLNRIYTRTGDSGETALVSGERVPKDALRIECYGTVDELNAFVGLACQSASDLAPATAAMGELYEILVRVQHELFNMGSVLATMPEKMMPRQPRITEQEISALESEIDRFNATLPALKSFVLPGGSRLNAELHVCRTVCRRAERLAVALTREGGVDPISVRYLNRLSDALFVYSRWANHLLDVNEVLWQPNRAASAR
jgi:cob(I)alamin adenosyltransferase